MSTPEILTCTRVSGPGPDGSTLVTATLRISPGLAAVLASSATPLAFDTAPAPMTGGGPSIWSKTGAVEANPLLNTSVAGPAVKPTGTMKFTWAGEAYTTGTAAPFKVTTAPPDPSASPTPKTEA